MKDYLYGLGSAIVAYITYKDGSMWQSGFATMLSIAFITPPLCDWLVRRAIHTNPKSAGAFFGRWIVRIGLCLIAYYALMTIGSQ